MEKTENLIQQQIVIYLTNKYCLKHHQPRFIVFAVPNGGKRDVREAKTLKNTGLLKGVSDLIFQTDKCTYYIEVKTDKGIQSPEQKDFQERIEALGKVYLLVKSLDDIIMTKLF
jgi:hypothetical protein